MCFLTFVFDAAWWPLLPGVRVRHVRAAPWDVAYRFRATVRGRLPAT